MFVQQGAFSHGDHLWLWLPHGQRREEGGRGLFQLEEGEGERGLGLDRRGHGGLHGAKVPDQKG